jgi:NAD(P)-dependent dehydrogenase (short-subunit alcohol dehydrogenase family)
LHGLGYVVYGLARRVDRMAGLDQLGVRTLAVDVTDEQATAAAIEQIVAEQGRIDVLVNNAGYGSYGAVEDVPLSEARYQLEVNLFGLARLIQLVLPHMRRQGSGRIINISSIGGKIYEPLGAWYHAAKFAVEGLSDSLRVELRPFGIDVVIIEPGAIHTEWGAISAQKLRQSSAGTAYQNQAATMAAVLESFSALASPPSVIADTIARAATAVRPRSRYVAGRGARTIITARQLLPDWAFDALITSGYQLAGKLATRQRGTAKPAPELPTP